MSVFALLHAAHVSGLMDYENGSRHKQTCTFHAHMRSLLTADENIADSSSVFDLERMKYMSGAHVLH